MAGSWGEVGEAIIVIAKRIYQSFSRSRVTRTFIDDLPATIPKQWGHGLEQFGLPFHLRRPPSAEPLGYDILVRKNGHAEAQRLWAEQVNRAIQSPNFRGYGEHYGPPTAEEIARKLKIKHDGQSLW